MSIDDFYEYFGGNREMVVKFLYLIYAPGHRAIHAKLVLKLWKKRSIREQLPFCKHTDNFSQLQFGN